MAVKIMTTREARSKFRILLDTVFTGQADVVIERHGLPVAVLIPVEDYRELQDELDDLRAARRAAAVYEAWKRDPASGQPYEAVRAELIDDGLLDE